MRSDHISNAEPNITGKDIAGVLDALKERRLSQGKYVDLFEREFAEYVGTKEAIAFNSGTAALHVCLASIGAGLGDEVITSPFTFAATTNAIVLMGAKPVFVDIEIDVFNIDPNKIEKRITKRTKAIVPVHYAGQCAEMDEIVQIAKKYNIFVLEDAAEAHGAFYKNRKAGTLGHAAAFSFYPNKNMTTGEGGMLTTNDKELAVQSRILRNHGQDERYHHVKIGWNYKMPDYVAALGRSQLKNLELAIEKRRKVAEYYTRHLKEIESIFTPNSRAYNRHTYMLYPIRTKTPHQREVLREALEENGVETRVCFPSVHLQPIYSELFGFKRNDYPTSELASDTVLCLPMYPTLTRKDQDFIINVIKEEAQGFNLHQRVNAHAS